MILKYLFVIGLIFLFFLMSSKEGGLKRYYFLTVVMFMVRELDMKPLGDIVPAAVMTTLLFISLIGKVPDILRGWKLFAAYLFISLFLSLINSVDMRAALYWVFTLYVTMMLAIMPKFLFTREEDLIVLIRCILGVCSVFAITTLVGYYGYADGSVIYAGKIEDATYSHSSRIYGITPSNLIQIISVISIVLMPFAKMKKKWMEWVLIALFFYAALVTLKRMSFIAMMASFAYYGYTQLRHGKIISIIAIVVICVAILPEFWDELSYRFEIAGFGGHEVEDHSTESRFFRIDIAKNAFYQSMIFGNGAAYIIYVHNGFWEIVGNCGIVGLLIVFLRMIPKPKDIISLHPWAFASFLFVITAFMLESSINHVQMMAFLGMYLGGYFASKNLNIEYRIK